ncbi:Ger(x)C family spore germination protein [Bacillus sp. 2205SS5-2]|uniref:Ger(x)C family spore germination protein n=1 Tax=Bacillus sp. 2205SS5-2 TaxID=3109031 RepID=UPI0030067B97
MKRLIYFLSILFLITGCGSQVIDDLAMLDAVAYDLSEDEEKPLTVTAQYPIITQEGVIGNEILSVNANSSKDSRIQFSHESNLKMVSGQINIALFGEKLAEVGLKTIIDTFMRDPSLGPRVYFVVTKGNAKDILEYKHQEGPDTARYLRTFSEKLDIENESANYNSYQVIRDYFDDGIDPIMPYFIIKNKKISLDGYALFNKDKFVHHISTKQSATLFYLRDDIHKGTLSIDVSDAKNENLFPEQLMFNYHKKDYSLNVKMNENQPISVEIVIELEGRVLEYTGEKYLDNEKVQKQLEEKIKVHLDEQSTEFIELTKEINIDPIGIGRYVRNKLPYNEWKKMNWEEVYPTLDINVSLDMKLIDVGQAK